jgi:signal transduction histidine kinase
LRNIFVFGLVSFIVAGILIYLVLMDFARSRKQREEAVFQRRLAMQSARMKEEFLHTVSHEIRTPLASIKLYSDILCQNEEDPDKKKQIATVQASANHMTTIINDLLDFAKMQAGKLSIEEIPFELHEVVEEVKNILEPESANKQLYLSAEIDPAIPKLVGDPVRLKQILLNLVKNSVKFTERGGIGINAQRMRTGDGLVEVRFSVTDTGIGIRSEKIATIFQEYAQAEESTTRKYGGTGLGLTISKKLVELQNGTIEVQSEVGKGSTFSFTIPYKTGT